jgi:hypothetical protein
MANKKKDEYVSPNAPQGVDYADLFPAVGMSVGLDDITKIANVYRQNKGIFDALFGWLKQVFVKSDERKDNGASQPVVVPAPVLPPPAPPKPEARAVRSLKVKWYFIEIPKESAHAEEGDIPNKNMKIATKQQFDRYVAGKDALPRRSRLHIDITPVDQYGKEFEPGDEANKVLLRGDGYPAMRHIITGPVVLTNEYDDYGCTPVLKIPKDVNLPGRAAITYQAKLGEIESVELDGPVAD